MESVYVADQTIRNGNDRVVGTERKKGEQLNISLGLRAVWSSGLVMVWEFQKNTVNNM